MKFEKNFIVKEIHHLETLDMQIKATKLIF